MNRRDLLIEITGWIFHIFLVVYNAYLLFGNGKKDVRIGIILLIFNIIAIIYHFIRLARNKRD